jgi:hypothetical protein
MGSSLPRSRFAIFPRLLLSRPEGHAAGSRRSFAACGSDTPEVPGDHFPPLMSGSFQILVRIDKSSIEYEDEQSTASR